MFKSVVVLPTNDLHILLAYRYFNIYLRIGQSWFLNRRNSIGVRGIALEIKGNLIKDEEKKS